MNGELLVRSHTTSLPEVPTTFLLLMAAIGVVLLPSLYVGRTARALGAAEERLALHAWQLRQIVAEQPDRTPPPR